MNKSTHNRQRLLTKTRQTLRKRSLLLAFAFAVLGLGSLSGLSGCSEPETPTGEGPKTARLPSAQTAQGSKAGSYIQPTTVPTTNAQRQAQLDSLKLKPDSAFEQHRLALFLRYTLIANDKSSRLEPLEQLLNEIGAMVEQHQDDHELLALLGSATSLKTIFFLDNLGKTSLLSKKGSRYLDRAVKKAPQHLGVRLYRGITYAEMPAFLGKARQAVADFTLLKMAMGANATDDFSAMVDYYFGMALLKDQQADAGIRQLQLVAKRNISPWSMRAVVLMKEKG